MKRYKLLCIAPDGETKTEGEYETIEEAWQRNENMGSRWFFYPFRAVITSKMVAEQAHGLEYLGKCSIKTLIRYIQANAEELLVD